MSKYTAKTKLKQFLGLGLVGGATFSSICLYKGDEGFYRGLATLLHRLDGEFAHKSAVFAFKNGFYFKSRLESDPSMGVDLWGLHFRNPVGIAAGFDKHGEAFKGLADIGFGFVEVGSVTPKPQEGNPKPRVFRLNEDEAVINRYGFNSEGHAVVADRLRGVREAQEFQAVLGINLGKNKTSPSASQDYTSGVVTLGPLADYLVINISSPNTPGLRSLQGKSDLSSLIKSVLDARESLKLSRHLPILVKIAPDLTEEDKKDIAEVVLYPDTRIDGLIVSNTTVSRPKSLKSAAKEEIGGLSGAPVRDLSTGCIRDMFRLTGGLLPIIGVGGVADGEHAWQKVSAGASLVQLYSSLVYQGPPVVDKVNRELRDILIQKGFKNIQEAVGCEHKIVDQTM